MAISKKKARVVAIVLTNMKQDIIKLAKEEDRSESAMAAKLLKIGLDNYKK